MISHIVSDTELTYGKLGWHSMHRDAQEMKCHQVLSEPENQDLRIERLQL